MGHGHHARARADGALQRHHVELAVIEDGNPDKARAAALTGHVPGHDVGVMLHLGDDHLVAGLEGQPCRDQIDGLGAAAREHDLLGTARIQEARERMAHGLVGLCRLVCERMQPAMHIGIGPAHGRAHGLDHDPGLLGGGRIVEIDQRVPVDLTRQDRHLGARNSGVKTAHQSLSVSHCLTTSRACSCSMRSTTSMRKASVSRACASGRGRPRLCR
jgi:hypothetical protein